MAFEVAAREPEPEPAGGGGGEGFVVEVPGGLAEGPEVDPTVTDTFMPDSQ